MDGLGDWVQSILVKGGEIYGNIVGQKYASEAAQAQIQAQAQAQTAQSQSKQWLYLGIGVVGAALLISLVRKVS